MEGCVVGGEQWETGGRQRCELRDCSPTDRRPGPRVIPEWLRYDQLVLSAGGTTCTAVALGHQAHQHSKEQGCVNQP